MEEFDMPKIIYAMYLTLQKKSNDDVQDKEIFVLEHQLLRTLDEKQQEIYEKIQKLYSKQQESDEKNAIKFVLNFIRNLF